MHNLNNSLGTNHVSSGFEEVTLLIERKIGVDCLEDFEPLLSFSLQDFLLFFQLF